MSSKAASHKKKSAPSLQKAHPASKPQAAARAEAESSEFDSDDSDFEDSEEEAISLQAPAHVKATVKPINESHVTSTANNPKKRKTEDEPVNQKKKKKAPSQDDEQEDENEDDNDNSTNNPEELIDVEFGLWDPRDIDFFTLKLLLKHYIPDLSFPLSDLCDVIVKQVQVGAMIKGEGTDEPLGFISLLSIQQHKSSSFMKFIYKYFSSHLPSHLLSSFQSVWSTSSLSDNNCLLLSDRLINVPPQIVPHLHRAILQDIEWTIADKNKDGVNIPTSIKDSFKNIKSIFLYARLFKLNEEEQNKQQAKQQVQQQATTQVGAFMSKKQMRKLQKETKKQTTASTSSSSSSSSAASSSSSVVPTGYGFLRFEEELYLQESEWAHSWHLPYSDEDKERGAVPQAGLLMLLPFKAIEKVAKKLELMQVTQE